MRLEIQRVVLVAQEHSPGQDNGAQDRPPINDWTAQVQALAANPAWAQEQCAQWQLLHQQDQHLQYQQQLVGVVDNGSLASASRGRQVHWGPVEYGTRERIGLVGNRPFQNNARARKHESSTGLVWSRPVQ